MKNIIYFDNASTSFPKAPGVGNSVEHYIAEVGGNVNRGATSNQVENVIYETRELLCEYFNFDNPQHLIYTMNVTYALNMLIYGLLKEGDDVIVSSLEHNAVVRPLNRLADIKNITFSKIPCDDRGVLDLDSMKGLIRSSTKAVVMTHASNAFGTINPLEEVGKFCRENGLYFIIDSAQTAGKLRLDAEKLNAHAIAFTGHKGLLGPQGIGGFVATKEFSSKLEPLILGGTGSFSEHEIQPLLMPDKFESGTLNIPGIYGLNTSLKYIFDDQEEIFAKEMQLAKVFLEGISDLKDVKIVGIKDLNGRVGVVSLDFPLLDNGEVCHALSKEYGILTRSGMHCAPSAHKALGTFPKGTVRFSFGHRNTEEEVKFALRSIEKIIS